MNAFIRGMHKVYQSFIHFKSLPMTDIFGSVEKMILRTLTSNQGGLTYLAC